jgi:mRNA interferase RelE/StbE
VSVPVLWRKDAKEDFRDLPSYQVQLEASEYIRRIGRTPTYGQPLEFRVETGDLSDCFKIYINNRKHRIVYRPVPDADNPKAIELILIGARSDFEAYVEALKRLSRPPGERVFPE